MKANRAAYRTEKCSECGRPIKFIPKNIRVAEIPSKDTIYVALILTCPRCKAQFILRNGDDKNGDIT